MHRFAVHGKSACNRLESREQQALQIPWHYLRATVGRIFTDPPAVQVLAVSAQAAEHGGRDLLHHVEYSVKEVRFICPCLFVQNRFR